MTGRRVIPEHAEELQDPRDLSGWQELLRRLRVLTGDPVARIEAVVAGLLIFGAMYGLLVIGAK
jgi:hypothetical protein